MAQTTISYCGKEAAATTFAAGHRTGEKRPAPNDPGASKHRKTGIDPSWVLDFPWLETSGDANGEPKMWRSLCRKNNCRPKKAPLGKAAWVEVPCRTITRQSLRDHIESTCHREAMRLESSHILVEKQGGIAECFEGIVSVQKKAFIGHLQCMHLLAKCEIAHTTNFTPLVELAKSLGAVYLGEIAMGQNMKYTSEREIVLALAETVIEPIKEYKPPHFSPY